MSGCLERKEDNGNGRKYARRRFGIMVAGWIIGPLAASVLTVLIIAVSNWVDVVVVTRESPGHITENKGEIKALKNEVSELKRTLTAINTKIDRVLEEHIQIRETDREIQAEQKALWHRDYESRQPKRARPSDSR